MEQEFRALSEKEHRELAAILSPCALAGGYFLGLERMGESIATARTLPRASRQDLTS